MRVPVCGRFYPNKGGVAGYVNRNLDSSYASQIQRELDLISPSFQNRDLLVVVCDPQSIRYYHTDHTKIGKQFLGDDQDAILSGSSPYISEATGSLGRQRRAFSPIRDASGTILGFSICSFKAGESL
ncbi:DUF6783 domain-containing protein [Blautia faecicola]|uniref:DUF6783 domain-containing protein n=1 Tax=Blautia faecicola TaxID=2509240 RepID=UPI003FD6DD1A